MVILLNALFTQEMPFKRIGLEGDSEQGHIRFFGSEVILLPVAASAGSDDIFPAVCATPGGG